MSDLVIAEDLREEYQRLMDMVKSAPVENPPYSFHYQRIAEIERISRAERDNAELKCANELDRRSLWAVIRAIDEEITGRMWIIEGRGSYEWDDAQYQKEFGWAIHAIQEKLEPLRKMAHDLTNCPENEKGVNSVRKLEQDNKALRERVERYEKSPYNAAAVRIAELDRQLADATDKLQLVDDWCKAYPLDVFTEPDLKEVRRLLGDTLLTQLSAYNMRHVLKGIERIITAPPEQGKCFNCNFANLRTWEPSKILLCESCRRNGGTEDHYQPIAPPEQKNPCLICGHEIDEHEYREATNSVVCPPPEPQSKEARK
jgi:hypothetical protein